MSVIQAGNTTTTSLIYTGDTTGNLVFTTGGANTVALTLANTQTATFSGAVTANSLVSTGTINALNTFGFENRIINGSMTIDQRNAGVAVTVNGTALFTLDRWIVEDGSSAILSVQQVVDAPAGFYYSLKANATTATGTVSATQYDVITQQIEGYNVADLDFGNANAKTITVSFWVKASVIGQYSLTLTNDVATRINPQSYTINVANTWEQKSVTFTGDITGTWLKTNGRGLSVNFYTVLGSTYLGVAGWNGSSIYGVTGQSNAFATIGNTFQITGVQLEVGSQATSFDFRDYGRELILCQRYTRYVNTGTFGFVANTTTVGFFPTYMNMRASPTGSLTAGSLVCDNGQNNITAASPTFSSIVSEPDGARFFIAGFTGLTASTVFPLSTANRVLLSAEL